MSDISGDQIADYVAKAKGDEPPRCDHICRLDEGHVERGEVHQYGYELPSPREDRYQEGYDAGFADGIECVCDETSMRNCPVHQNGSPDA